MKKKYILFLVLALLFLAAGIGYYQFSRGHKSMSDVAADISITATALAEAYALDETAANARYLNKNIAVTGELIQVEQTEGGAVNLVLAGTDMSNVVCELDKRYTDKLPEPRRTITIQGVCTGSLMDVVLVRCVPKSDA